MIFRQKKFESKLSLEEIESHSSLSFQKETLYSNDLNQSFPVKQVGEAIISQITLKVNKELVFDGSCAEFERLFPIP